MTDSAQPGDPEVDQSAGQTGSESAGLMRAIEALLLVADEPMESSLVAQLLDVSVPRVDEICSELTTSYAEQARGIVVCRVAGGYRLQTAPDLAGIVEQYVLHGRKARISAAALETLAIVAYKQPVSRAQVTSIRGVNVEGVMRTLQQRGLVEAVGQDEGPGQAILYGTTVSFLEQLGIDSIDDLPPLTDFMPETDIVEALEQTLRVSSS
ncbi:MAG: SMC-Scp complex subunit ScpB [Acidimicrobiales bacterium]